MGHHHGKPWYQKGAIHDIAHKVDKEIIRPAWQGIKEQGFGIKTSSKNDGQDWDTTYNAGPVEISGEGDISLNPTKTAELATGQTNTTRTTTSSSSKPAAYSRSTAATARDIAQGGMTKDEVEEFNQRHPNETANIRG